jgi:hypothetical protein
MKPSKKGDSVRPLQEDFGLRFRLRTLCRLSKQCPSRLLKRITRHQNALKPTLRLMRRILPLLTLQCEAITGEQLLRRGTMRELRHMVHSLIDRHCLQEHVLTSSESVCAFSTRQRALAYRNSICRGPSTIPSITFQTRYLVKLHDITT